VIGVTLKKPKQRKRNKTKAQKAPAQQRKNPKFFWPGIIKANVQIIPILVLYS